VPVTRSEHVPWRSVMGLGIALGAWEVLRKSLWLVPALEVVRRDGLFAASCQWTGQHTTVTSPCPGWVDHGAARTRPADPHTIGAAIFVTVVGCVLHHPGHLTWPRPVRAPMLRNVIRDRGTR